MANNTVAFFWLQMFLIACLVAVEEIAVSEHVWSAQAIGIVRLMNFVTENPADPHRNIKIRDIITDTGDTGNEEKYSGK